MGKTMEEANQSIWRIRCFSKKLPLESMHTTLGSRETHIKMQLFGKRGGVWMCLVFGGPATLMTQLHRLGLRAPARCNQVGYSDSISQMERDLVHHPALLKQSLTSLTIINYTFFKDWICCMFLQGCPVTAGVGLPHFEPNEVSCKPSLGAERKALNPFRVFVTSKCGLHCRLHSNMHVFEMLPIRVIIQGYHQYINIYIYNIVNYILFNKTLQSPQKTLCLYSILLPVWCVVMVIFFCIGNDKLPPLGMDAMEDRLRR